MSRPRTAIVVGAGVAGTAAAMALNKAGIETAVLEARSSAREPDGVMLTLATNGIDALRALNADNAVLDLGFPTPEIGLRSYTGKRLGATRTGGTLADGTVSRTLRRADLVAALRAEARSRDIPVQHGKLERIEERHVGVRAVLDDGSSIDADILVGADGVHSVVRREIDPQAPAPRYAGLITTGGYATGINVDAPTGISEMIFGKRAFFGYATAPDGTVWWFVNLPHPRQPARGEVEAVPTEVWRTRFAELYAADTGPALDIIAASSDFAPMTTIHTMPHLPRWHTALAVVVGDAAHAPSPTSGQGASLSIEDAVVLATCLRDHDSADTAFTRYEQIRRPRVEKIIKAAARINNSKAPGPAGRWVRDAILPLILKSVANTKSATAVFAHHVDWDGRTDEVAVR